MGTARARFLLAACFTLLMWGCFVALDFGGYDTSRADGNGLAEAGFDGAIEGDFTFSATPRAVSLVRGGPAVPITITVQPLGGFRATIAISQLTAPSGVQLAGLTIVAGVTNGNATIAATTDAPTGKGVLLLRASSGGLQHDITIDVVVRGASGSIDPTFGDGGVVTLPPVFPDVSLNAMLIGDDDRIVLGGAAFDDAGSQSFVLTRMTANGAPDPTFGSQGTVTTTLPASTGVGGLVGLPGSEVVAAASAGGNIFVVRYRADGTLDSTFGTLGIHTIVNDLQVVATMRRPTGRIILAGSTSKAGLLQLVPDGSLDPTFADGGVAIHSSAFGMNAAALAPDGTVVFGFGSELGTCVTSTFRPDGSSVGASGAGKVCKVVRVALDGAGYRGILGSSDGPQSSKNMDVLLELPDGGRATPQTFVRTDTTGDDIAFDAEGRILTAEPADGNGRFAVRRLTRDLSPDTAFGGTTGVVQPSVGPEARTRRVGVQSDGRIIAVGTYRRDGRSAFALVRVWP